VRISRSLHAKINIDYLYPEEVQEISLSSHSSGYIVLIFLEIYYIGGSGGGVVQEVWTPLRLLYISI